MYGGDYGGYGQQDSPHKSSWTEETVAAAAGFAGKKDRSQPYLFERKKESNLSLHQAYALFRLQNCFLVQIEGRGWTRSFVITIFYRIFYN